jgi:CheY-like chemotaxis protein
MEKQMDPSTKRRVLLADDNPDGADTMAAFLELLGFEVTVARDGPTAVAEAARALPDVAILDLGMPGFDGWEACRRIRSLPGGGATKIIALSGWGSPEARAKSREAGFDAHWTKPAEAASLLAVLRPAPER